MSFSIAVRHEDGTIIATLRLDGFSLYQSIAALEKTAIDVALRSSDGNKTKAAKLLGLNRTTLVEKIKKYNAK